MGLDEAFVFSCPFSAPVDVEDEQGDSEYVLVGHLVSPGPVLFGPCDIAVVDELRLLSFLELPLEDFLLGLEGEVFVEASPVIEVIVGEAKLLSQ